MYANIQVVVVAVEDEDTYFCTIRLRRDIVGIGIGASKAIARNEAGEQSSFNAKKLCGMTNCVEWCNWRKIVSVFLPLDTA